MSVFRFTARFLTQPMDQDWKARLQEAQGDDASKWSPEARKVRERLLAIGGEEVCIRQVEPSDIHRLVKRGELWSGEKSRLVKMEPISCHQNSLALWKEGKGDLANGFALSKDGLWREHSWIVSDGGVIETTTPRMAYYGAKLRKSEIMREYGRPHEGPPPTQPGRLSQAFVDSFRNHAHDTS